MLSKWYSLLASTPNDQTVLRVLVVIQPLLVYLPSPLSKSKHSSVGSSRVTLFASYIVLNWVLITFTGFKFTQLFSADKGVPHRQRGCATSISQMAMHLLLFFVFVLFLFVLCTLCCQLLRISHFLLPLWYSLMFILTWRPSLAI